MSGGCATCMPFITHVQSVFVGQHYSLLTTTSQYKQCAAGSWPARTAMG